MQLTLSLRPVREREIGKEERKGRERERDRKRR
jgi:hypothetical protein